MITVSTLVTLTKAAIGQFAEGNQDLYCPMIDARRMEVFTAVYKHSLEEFLQPCNKILNERSFEDLMNTNKMVFFGSGAQKWQKILPDAKLIFLENVNIVHALCSISYEKYRYNNYTDLIHSEPTYLKEFYDAN